ncbi:MAG: ATP-binding protein, partial [Roseobacter sp.]|nr:ATP-binding protein [Roseobacter sp.]
MSKRLKLGSPRVAYMVGLLLICVTLASQWVGTRIQAHKQGASVVEINLAGRQRMLSQRIALTIERLSQARAAQDEDLAAALSARLLACAHLMEVSHRALVARTTVGMQTAMEMGATCLKTDPQPGAFADYPLNDVSDAPLLERYTMFARGVASGATVPGDAYSDILGYGSIEALLAELDAATASAQINATQHLRHLQLLSWIVVISLVLGGVALVFWPLVRNVENSLARLRSAVADLRKSEQRLKDFAATGAHQFWETDADHRFRWIEAAGTDPRIKDKSTFLGKTRWELTVLNGRVSDMDWTDHKRTLDMHQSFRNLEYSVRLADGSAMWWRVHGRPVFAADGAFLGYRGTSMEVTREKTAEQQARHSERMKSLGQLTAGIAHDFNNLLAIIRGNAELIDFETDPLMQKRCSEEIISAVEKGASLTNRLLAFGRVQDLRAEKIDLRAFFESVSVLVKNVVSVDFEVEFVAPDPGLCVIVDRHQLENAFINLALNARDAASPGGKLVIAANVVEGTRMRFAQSPDFGMRDLVCISFSDNGTGISEEDLGKVFEPFYTTKPVGEGSGLGLSMVYGFALQSDGFVDITSAPEQGTCVRLCLPAARQTAQKVPDEETQDTAVVAG